MGHFGNLVGNSSAFGQLASFIDGGNYPNCILLRGPRGVGKFTSALQFARVANCLGTRKLDCSCLPCEKFKIRVSPNCLSYPQKVSKEILRDLHYKLTVVSAAGQRFVVMRCEHLDLATQDMFLKTIEEPSERTSFLITSSTYLPKRPIVSRSVVVQFGPCQESDLVDYVGRNPAVAKMFHEYTNAECEVILVLAGGSPGALFGLMSDPVIRTKIGLLRAFFDRVSRPEFFRQLSGVDEGSFARMVRILAMSVMQGSKVIKVSLSEAQWINESLTRKSVCPLKWRLVNVYMQLREAA